MNVCDSSAVVQMTEEKNFARMSGKRLKEIFYILQTTCGVLYLFDVPSKCLR